MRIAFTVYGTPQPQGSIRAFMPKGAKRPSLISDNGKLKPWRQDVSGKAVEAMAGIEPTDSAAKVTVRFYFAKPKSTAKSVVHKTTRPDVDKLARGILDALTGIAYSDDSQVVCLQIAKYFDVPERAEVEVEIPDYDQP